MCSVSKTKDVWEPVSYAIPKHWEYIDIDSAFSNLGLTGKKISQKDYMSTGKYPVIDQGKELIGGYSNDESKVIFPERAAIIFGDHTKCFKMIGTPFIAGADGIKVLVPKNNILPMYAFYACQSIKLPDRGYSRHFSFLRKSKFPLAPEVEQQLIVAKIEELFSELDSGIASLKTAREQLKIYRQALLKHAFEGKLTAQWRKDNADKLETPEQLLTRIQTERETRYQQQLDEWKQAVKDWEAKGKEGKKPSKPAIHKPLSTISAEKLEVLPELPKEWNYIRLAEIAAINSGMSVSKNRKLADPIEVNYLRVANVQRGYLDLSEIKSMNIEMVDLPRLQLEINDVLFNEGGDLDKLGRGWIWEGQVSQCITQNHVFRASPFVNEKYHAKFISYWGNSFGRDYFESGGKQTTNLASINKTVLSNFPIPLPSFREQQEIVNQLEEKLSIIEQNEKEIEDALAKAELLRQSILKKAFSGKLIIKN